MSADSAESTEANGRKLGRSLFHSAGASNASSPRQIPIGTLLGQKSVFSHSVRILLTFCIAFLAETAKSSVCKRQTTKPLPLLHSCKASLIESTIILRTSVTSELIFPLPWQLR